MSGDCLGASSDEFDNAGQAVCLSNNGSLYVPPTCKDASGIQVPYTELGEPSIEDCEGTAVVD